MSHTIGTNKLTKMIAITADESGKLPSEIELLQTGMWDAPYHGMFMITEQDVDEYIDNFNNDIRPNSSTSGVPIDEEHDAGAATGWIKKVFSRPNARGGISLWGSIDWTSLGEEKLLGGIYKFFSPEFVPEGYIDPEGKAEPKNNVLIGGGLTNRPLFKGLTPVMASDGTAQQQASEAGDDKLYINVKEQPVELEDIRKKPVADLNEDEKKVLADNVDQLTDEEKVTYGFAAAKTEEDAVVEDDKKEEDEEFLPPKKTEGDDPTISASDNVEVRITAGELRAFREAVKTANDLKAENDAIKASDTIGRLNETHGAFKAGELNEVTLFYLGLSDAQRTAFETKIVPAIQAGEKPKGELGSDAGLTSGQSSEQIIIKANEMAKAENITIGEATRRVINENMDLAKAHESDLKETN